MAKKKHLPFCSMCRYIPEKDLGKCMPVFFHNEFHVMLEKLTANVYVCPKCGVTATVKGFKKQEPFWVIDKRLRQERHIRAQQLRSLYHP